MSNRIRSRGQAPGGAGSTADVASDSSWHPIAQISLPIGLVEPIAIIVDCVLIVSLSVFTGIGYHWFVLGYFPNVGPYFAVGVVACTNFSAILAANRTYQFPNLANFRRQIYDVLAVWTVVFLILLVVAFSLKIGDVFSRGATFGFFILGIFSLVLWRAILAQLISSALERGAFANSRSIVIGEQSKVLSSRLLLELERCGYRSVNIFPISNTDLTSAEMPEPLAETVERAIKMAREDAIQHVFLMIPWAHGRCIDHIVDALNVLPIPIHLLPDDDVARYLNQRVLRIGGIWTAELKRTPLSRLEQALKRTLDIVGAAAGLIALLPLMLITSGLIKIDSAGPVFFRQKRIGFNGRAFRIYKFRTMTVLEDGPTIQQATRDDPRVTRIGRWIRRGSIDELPQLLNVLNGEMSLVGPRPHAAAHDTEYEQRIAAYAFRYHMKPGITGWAQVNGFRGQTQTLDLMAKRVDFDVWYINNWSMWLDIKIILRTIAVEFGFWRSRGY